MGATLAVGLALAAPALGGDEDPGVRLKDVERALEDSRKRQERLGQEAETLAGEIAGLRQEAIRTARNMQANEAALAALEDELAAMGAAEREKAAALNRRRERQAELLSALQRLGRHPPEALILQPAPPVDTVRGARLLGAAVPAIEAEARALGREIAQLNEVRRAIADRQNQLAARKEALAREDQRLAGLIARKAALQQRAAAAAESAAYRQRQLAAQARDLKDLIDRLEADRRRRENDERQREAEILARALAPPPERHAVETHAALAAPRPEPPSEATALDPGRPRAMRPPQSGSMILPVAGRVALGFGDPDDFGNPMKGLRVATRPGTRVIAPFDGRIAFAGPFRGYGLILIIEHGDGYHSLLAGMDRIDGMVGQWLVAGEPVGVMTSGDTPPSLYLELRRNGQPINPMPWLATPDNKVTG